MTEIHAEFVVVFDEHVLTRAFLRSSATFATYPRPPARSSNPCADALGVVIHHPQWGLVVSEAQLQRVGHALAAIGLPAAAVARYFKALTDLAVLSGGGVFALPGVPATVDRSRPEIDRVVAVAEWTQADAVVVDEWSTPAQGHLGDEVWFVPPRTFADHAPFVGR